MDKKNFFNTRDSIYSGLLTTENVWDGIRNLQEFLLNLFKEKKIKGNFAEFVYVDPTASVDSTVKIEGPAIIGRNAVVKYNAYIRENVIVGEESTVGHASEIKNSLIMSNTHVAHFNYVGDSIIGESVNFGAGAITANYRFDGQAIKVYPNMKKTNTHLNKLGAIIGDNCKIGVNSVLNPGTLLEKDCVVYPLTMVGGYHEIASRIK